MGRTLNLGQGGALVAVSDESLPDVPSQINMTFSVQSLADRLGEFAAAGSVVRRHSLSEGQIGMAIRFDRPVDLGPGV